MTDPNSPEQLQANVAGRKTAEDWLAMIEDEGIPELQQRAFWGALGRYALEKCGYSETKKIDVGPAPFTYAEALAFEKKIVPFGKYAGEWVGDVPAEYWTYITESDFNRDLSRYLKSEHFQRRQDG